MNSDTLEWQRIIGENDVKVTQIDKVRLDDFGYGLMWLINGCSLYELTWLEAPGALNLLLTEDEYNRELERAFEEVERLANQRDYGDVRRLEP